MINSSNKMENIFKFIILNIFSCYSFACITPASLDFEEVSDATKIALATELLNSDSSGIDFFAATNW